MSVACVGHSSQGPEAAGGGGSRRCEGCAGRDSQAHHHKCPLSQGHCWLCCFSDIWSLPRPLCALSNVTEVQLVTLVIWGEQELKKQLGTQ